MHALEKEILAFHTLENDPIKVHQYTLANGLKLFLTVNKDEPRIYTEIPVRVGSKHDPADTTGLAHYFEHMMFKGTDRFGTLDWEKEKVLLDEIEILYEKHRAEQDPAQKKLLYAEIDRKSFDAAKLAAANEYDKMVSTIGAKNTNAYTWVEQTVYVNDIPSNELERWFELEAERFRRPVLRLFHTELETVFEEYNISQDKDFRKVMKTMQECLTPTHPYGTQTTLGRGEDLKNPSQTNIYRFFDKYYVPNNMAIVLSGDFDPEEAVALAEKYFGHFEAKSIPPFHFEPQPALQQQVTKEVYGQEAGWIELGWLFPGAKDKDTQLLPLLSGMLYNQQAGLLDLNLVQAQKVLEAYAYPRIYEDYSALVIHAKPREGDSYDQLKAILLEQVRQLAEGNFEDWLPEAVVRDMKVSEIQHFEKNQGRASAITQAFVLGVEWKHLVNRWKRLSKVTKADIMELAQKLLNDHQCVVVYKHVGPDPNVMKVEKPPLTPIEVNRTDSSAFGKAFMERNSPSIEPSFVDYKTIFQKAKLHNNVPLKVIQNKDAQLFNLYYVFEIGKLHDRELKLSSGYLPYLGTDTLSPKQIQQEFYKLGVHFSSKCDQEFLYISLTGLQESFGKAVTLMEQLLTNATPNHEALANMKQDIFLRRENNKMDKSLILRSGMASLAQYGSVTPFNDVLKKEEIEKITATELVERIKNLRNFKHEVFYYGAQSARQVAKLLKTHHQVPATLTKPQIPTKYKEQPTQKDKILFVHFPMVQVELMLVSKGKKGFDMRDHALALWFNQYFGYGLSSIVFQEIRESKALAYSAYAYSATPSQKDKAFYLRAYVGTQPDKLHDAITAFQQILEDMPVSATQIENARQSLIKQLSAERITKTKIYWQYRSLSKLGLHHDTRQDILEIIQNSTAQDLINYHNQVVKGRKYTWLVLGDQKTIDFKYLRTIGSIKKLTLEDIFGY